MAKDGGNSLIMLGGLAVAGYFAYEYFFKPVTVATVAPGGTVTTTTGGAAATTTTGTTGAASTATPLQPVTPLGPTLASIYAAMVAEAASDPNFTGSGDNLASTPYRWNFYLSRHYSGTVPDPAPLFADTSANVTAAAYWAKMAPALQAANSGLSGMGNFQPSFAGCGW